LIYESDNKFSDAVKIYEQLKTDYSETREGKEADKYISLAKIKGGIE